MERTRPSGEAGRPAGSRAQEAGAPRREMRLRSGRLLAALCLGAAFPLLWYAAWQGSRGESRRRVEWESRCCFPRINWKSLPSAFRGSRWLVMG